MRSILKQDFHEGISWSWAGHIDIGWPANCKTISMQQGTPGHGSNNWDKSCLPGMKKERERKSRESHSVKWDTTPSSEITPFRLFRIFFLLWSKPLRYAIPFTWALWRWPSFKNLFWLNGPNLKNLKLQWILWGTLGLPRLVFPWTKLEDGLCQ